MIGSLECIYIYLYIHMYIYIQWIQLMFYDNGTWFHLSNCFPFFLAISHHPKSNKPNKKGKQIVDFCWWKISQTTTCHVKKLYERWDVLHINCLAGFLPSTVFLQSSRSELDAGLHAAILHAGDVGKRFSGLFVLSYFGKVWNSPHEIG